MVGQSGCELVDSARDAELALRVRGAPLSATTSNGDGPDGSEAAAAPHLGENVSRFGGGTARFPSTGCYDQRRRRMGFARSAAARKADRHHVPRCHDTTRQDDLIHDKEKKHFNYSVEASVSRD